jgi:hypothetical protein
VEFGVNKLKRRGRSLESIGFQGWESMSVPATLNPNLRALSDAVGGQIGELKSQAR